MKKAPVHRPEILESAPLHYAPENEMGVVFLFAHMAKRLRVTIEKIRPQFPDCIAYQKIGGREKPIRIEFEYRSRQFKTHKHKRNGCDWIVCWEHDWPDVPGQIRVIELRSHYGLGFNIWIQPVSGEYKKILLETKNAESWSVPSLANKDDLLLYYHTAPDSCIKDVFKLISPVRKERAMWKKGKDYMGSIRCVCSLKSPIFLEDMRRDKVLKTSGFVRGGMQGRPRATEYWPNLYDLIIRRNPSVKNKLAKYSPDKC